MSAQTDLNQPQVEPRKRYLQPITAPTWSAAVPDPKNVQGDIHPTFSRKSQNSIFFQVADVDKFRPALAKLIPHITTSAGVTKYLVEIDKFRREHINDPKPIPREQLVPCPQVNISFSAKILPQLGLEGNIGDNDFKDGQGPGAIGELGDHPDPSDPDVPNWDPAFKMDIHGLILVADHCERAVVADTQMILELLGDSITFIHQIIGNHLEGALDGHEHFGWRDGISQPALVGLTQPLPGQLQCNPGVVIFGYEGDPVSDRPAWTKDGSLLVFRKLKQYAPEFKSFLARTGLRGSRLFGRWQSGAPLDVTPDKDDPVLAKDPLLNNKFDYTKLELGETSPGQIRCPFAAHIRKSAPRKGTSHNIPDGNLEKAMIVRSSIPYGKKVSPEEEHVGETQIDRGLVFICYQTSIAHGFKHLQKDWFNNPEFPFQWKTNKKVNAKPGFDPILGSNMGLPREVTGTAAYVEDFKIKVNMPSDFVVARGGEYFFVPSIPTLNLIATGKGSE